MTNETRYIGWYETCWFNCRLDVRVCNNKQRRIKKNADANLKN